jgi:hypothetical protein
MSRLLFTTDDKNVLLTHFFQTLQTMHYCKDEPSQQKSVLVCSVHDHTEAQRCLHLLSRFKHFIPQKKFQILIVCCSNEPINDLSESMQPQLIVENKCSAIQHSCERMMMINNSKLLLVVTASLFLQQHPDTAVPLLKNENTSHVLLNRFNVIQAIIQQTCDKKETIILGHFSFQWSSFFQCCEQELSPMTMDAICVDNDNHDTPAFSHANRVLATFERCSPIDETSLYSCCCCSL